MELNTIVNTICEKCPGSILKETDHHDIHEITVAAQSFYEVMKTLHGDKEFGFDMLTDVVGIDRTPRAPRFDVLYLLLSSKNFTRLSVRLETDEGQDVPSCEQYLAFRQLGGKGSVRSFGDKFFKSPGPPADSHMGKF